MGTPVLLGGVDALGLTRLVLGRNLFRHRVAELALLVQAADVLAQTLQRLGVDLAHAALGDAHHAADLLHGEPLLVRR